MNDTLSTLIAFVGVLIVFSMLTQSVQEALKNLFTLRAGVWESFWSSVYRSEFGLQDGTAQEKTHGRLGRAWASLTTMWDRKPVGQLDSKLKQLQDNVTKAAALLGGAKAGLKEIADISLSTASQEVVNAKREALTGTLRALAGLNLGTLFSIYKKLDGENTISNLENKLSTFLGESPNRALTDFQAACSVLLETIATTEKKLTEYRLRLEQRFDAWMAQVDTAYKRHMLLVTLLIGVAFVLAFNADAFSIYRQLGSSPQTRTVALSHAQNVANKSLASKGEDLNAIRTSIQAKDPISAKAKASAFCTNLADDFKMFKQDDTAAKATEIKTAIDKLDATESSLPAITDQEPALASLFVGLNKTAVETYARDVSSLDLPLGWQQDIHAFKNAHGRKQVCFWLLSKFGGLLLTLFLVTFGAPFWNDVLSALVGVKNVLGNKGKSTS